MQETLVRPESLSAQPNRLRRLGQKALAGEVITSLHQRQMNNDPLAHVSLVLSEGGSKDTYARITDEIVTDLAERSPELHFYGTFEYNFNGSDLVTTTGVSLRNTYENGLFAARRDGIPYGIERAESLQAQLPYIIEWAQSKNQQQLVFFSLCPNETELDIATQKRLNFKPERQMSSNWLFEKTADGTIRMHAFSLDGHTLSRHGELLESLGLPDPKSTTLEELTSPYLLSELNGSAAVERLRSVFDNGETYFGVTLREQRAANEVVRSAEHVIDYYHDVTYELALAMVKGRVTRGLRQKTKELLTAFHGYSSPVSLLNRRIFQRFEIEDAAEFVDYLRSQALPHYVYAKEPQVSIADSGVDAIARGASYEGACPTSGLRSPEEQQADDARRLEFYVLRLRPRREKEFMSQYCPCCLPSPKKNMAVKAWMGDGFIGCDDCGHIVDVCGGIYEQGRPRPRKTNKEK